MSTTDYQTKRWKGRVRDRLIKKGVYDEARKLMEQIRVEMRKVGVEGPEAVIAAWKEAIRRWLPDEEGLELETSPGGDGFQPPLRDVPKKGSRNIDIPLTEKDAPKAGIYTAIPKSWGKLPDTARWEDEVEWVHQQLVYCLQRRSDANRISLLRATKPAPSAGAVSLMLTAAQDPRKFENETVPKAKKVFVDDSETMKRERKRTEEIHRILKRMEEFLDAKEGKKE